MPQKSIHISSGVKHLQLFSACTGDKVEVISVHLVVKHKLSKDLLYSKYQHHMTLFHRQDNRFTEPNAILSTQVQ